MRTYALGQTIRITANLLDENDVVIAPDGLRLLLFGPTDSVAQVIGTAPDPADPTKLYAEVAPSAAGVWRYRWEVPTGITAADEKTFAVLPRAVPAP